jgi:Helitron helicase-like domain at N-terminus
LFGPVAKPDLFNTMTRNPYWDEIASQLLPGQTVQDRPDLVARVFKLKLKRLLKDIKNGVLDRIVAHSFIYSHYPRVQLPAASHYVLLLLSMFYFPCRLVQLASLVLSLSAFCSMVQTSLCS